MELLDGGFAVCAGCVPVGLWGDGIETEEGLEEQLAEAGVLFCEGGLGLGVDVAEEGLVGGEQGVAGRGELGVDGGNEGLLGVLEGRGDVGIGDDGDG